MKNILEFEDNPITTTTESGYILTRINSSVIPIEESSKIKYEFSAPFGLYPEGYPYLMGSEDIGNGSWAWIFPDGWAGDDGIVACFTSSGTYYISTLNYISEPIGSITVVEPGIYYCKNGRNGSYFDQRFCYGLEEVKKLDKKYLPDEVLNIQTDWNQNNENQLDYIKNKPFWEIVTTDIIEPEANPVTVTAADGRVLTRISDTLVYANDIVDLTIESDYSLAESNYQSNVFTYKDVLHHGTPSNYIQVYEFGDGYIGWIYRDENGSGNNLVLFCYAPCTIDISCEGYGGSHFRIYDANISQPGIYYYFETFNSVEVALTSSQIKKIDSKFLPEGPVYSPNGTMLSQKLDGDGSFEFVNEPADIREDNPKQFTEENRVGTYSVTLGGKSAATGKRALAEGTSTWAEGNYSHAEGNKSYAAGAQSHAEGAQTYAYGEQSHTEGWKTRAVGSSAHAEGAGTAAMTSNSHAEGQDAYAYGSASHAEGNSSIVYGNYAHGEGDATYTHGVAAHAEGSKTRATADYTHAEGHTTHATNIAAHAEGSNTNAAGERSHAEGNFTTASGYNTHAEGDHTEAIHDNSHTSGWYTRSSNKNQTVIGQTNKDDADALFIVGNGLFDSYDVPTDSQRSNAFAVMNYEEPTIKIGNTTLTEAQLIKIINFIDSIEG